MSNRDFKPLGPFLRQTTVDPRFIHNQIRTTANGSTPSNNLTVASPPASEYSNRYQYLPQQNHSSPPSNFTGPLGGVSLPPINRTTYRVADFITTSHSTHRHLHNSPPPQQRPQSATNRPWATASNPLLTLATASQLSRTNSFDFSRSQPTALSPTMPPTRRNSTAKRTQRSISTSPGPALSSSASKRQKTTHRRGSRASIKETETIDLADGEPEDGRLKDVLEKQRIEAVAAQGLNVPKDGSGETQGISSICCVICMDNMTDMTATSCGESSQQRNARVQRIDSYVVAGHVFCHACLLHALIAGENRAGPGETKRSQCPVCRKPLNRKKQADIIPLLLKKGLQTQPRKKAAQEDPGLRR